VPRLSKQTLYPSINARLTGPFLLIIVVIAGISIFIVARLVAGSIQERLNNQLVDSATAATGSITDLERQQLATLRLMAYTEGVADAITGREIGNLDLWLRPIASNARADSVIVFDDTGQPLLQLARVQSDSGVTYANVPPPDVSQWAGVQQTIHAGKDQAGDKFIDLVGEPPETLFYVTAPVKDDAGRVVGGISLGLMLSHLVERASEQALSSVAFFDAEGRVLGSSFRTVAWDQLALASGDATRLEDETRSGSPIEAVELNGKSYQILYAPLNLRGENVGLLAVGLPSHYIVERSSTSRNTFGILFAILFAAVGLMGLLTARTITRPIARLVSTSRDIRAGDLSKRVGLRIPDELGELAISFDHMTDQLVQRNREVHGLYVQQLQETAQRDAVLTNIGDAVIVQDPVGKIILQNRRAEELVNYVCRDAALHQEFVRLCRQPEALEHPRSVVFGEQFFSVLAKPVHLPDGAPLGHVIVFHDISALMEAERLKDELILQMSHELRTPLAAARGYVDLTSALEGQRMSEQGTQFVSGAIDNLTTLERLINQVIDVSTILADRFHLEIERFNLAELLETQAEIWTPIAHKRDLSLSLYNSSPEMWIEGDQERLGQMVDHLLRNACSYTLPGGAIEVYASMQDGCVRLHVIDNGVGIGPDEMEKVFERMYRGRSAEAGPTDARGLGLGLYFSKHIAEAHHGSIQLESKLDYGTVVTVDLPMRQHE
jgi:signal transduction histidine kinase